MVAAQETTLQELLEGTKQYLVPLYQRPYQWGKSQLEQLWGDIVELTEDRAEGYRSTHFIGSLVLAPPPASLAGGVTTFLVVDGQQRLTTLSLLLAAIRDHIDDQNPGENAGEEIKNRFLVNQYKKGRDHIKLVPTQADRSSFNAVIKRLPDSGGQDTIGTAYRFFRSQLTMFDDPDIAEDIQTLQEAVIEGLALVSISTHPDDNVHRIFQSLNNTGLKLTQGDLLRNYIFMRLPESDEEAYERYWHPLQEKLDNDQIEQLFWIDLAKDNPTVKVSDTFIFQQRRLDHLTTEAEIHAELSRLNQLASLYQLILHPELEGNPQIRLRLRRLKEWAATTPHPLVLELLHHRAVGNAADEELARALLTVESYLIRRLLVGRPTQGLNRIFRTAVSIVTGEEPIDKQVSRFLSTGQRHFTADDELHSAIMNNPFYRSGRANHRHAFLRWLEEEFGSQEPVDTSKLTIEHVMPQTLTPEWRSALEAACPGQDIEEVHDLTQHTLGNLTLTGYNSSLSNHSFDWKRAEMLKSGVRLSASIAEQKQWGPDQIHTRAEQLAEIIINAWPGPRHKDATTGDIAPVWRKLRNILTALPAGRWTSYGNIAAAIGTAAQPVGNYIAVNPLPNAHRVMRSNGEISANFRWLNPEDKTDPRTLLEDEGVSFTKAGNAHTKLRLSVEELTELLELTEGDAAYSYMDIEQRIYHNE
ncbi:Methylated-DNA--protein-cysteine methyltransferase [Corynebacterium occultum]|uniref:Methylated-DNA--protein-cysteine methyltransferase n=1 Tax=Corynebacterium occultum TaxID=2675219 RepID=A0A6B8VNE1_9CORY|nr:DUF262 domain-containing protein [Corynebacterium occultum]QGU07042.1 Methylated-DNA--protein-cysteine methyltransferase [Corynebacterium occultum]